MSLLGSDADERQNSYNALVEATDDARANPQDAFAWFTNLVAERRQLPIERVRILADGRVYTGRQALTEKLWPKLHVALTF